MSLSVHTPADVLRQFAQCMRTLRLQQGLTQADLAVRSGVSLGSLKRFETTGQVALESLLKLALVLGVLDKLHDFTQNLTQVRAPLSLDDLLTVRPAPKRGRHQ